MTMQPLHALIYMLSVKWLNFYDYLIIHTMNMLTEIMEIPGIRDSHRSIIARLQSAQEAIEADSVSKGNQSYI